MQPRGDGGVEDAALAEPQRCWYLYACPSGAIRDDMCKKGSSLVYDNVLKQAGSNSLPRGLSAAPFTLQHATGVEETSHLVDAELESRSCWARADRPPIFRALSLLRPSPLMIQYHSRYHLLTARPIHVPQLKSQREPRESLPRRVLAQKDKAPPRQHLPFLRRWMLRRRNPVLRHPHPGLRNLLYHVPSSGRAKGLLGDGDPDQRDAV